MRMRESGVATTLIAVLLLLTVFVQPVQGAGVNKSALVQIRIQGGECDNDDNVDDDNLLVGPKGVGFCRSSKPDECWTKMRFKWIGNTRGYEEVVITFSDAIKEDGNDVGQSCLTPDTFTLDSDKKEQEVEFETNPTCTGVQKKMVSFYKVIATGAGKKSCSKDPGVIIDH